MLTFADLELYNEYTIYTTNINFQVQPTQVYVASINNDYVLLRDLSYYSTYLIPRMSRNRTSHQNYIFLDRDEAYARTIEQINKAKKTCGQRIIRLQTDLAASLEKEYITFDKLVSGKEYPIYETTCDAHIRKLICTYEKCTLTVISEDLSFNRKVYYVLTKDEESMGHTKFPSYYLNDSDVLKLSIKYLRNKIRSLNKLLKKNLNGRGTQTSSV